MDTVWVDCFYYGFELSRQQYALYRSNAEMPPLPNGFEGRRLTLRKDFRNVLFGNRAMRRSPSRTVSLDENICVGNNVTE